MRDFAFAEARPRVLPAHRPSMLVVAMGIHALALVLLIQLRAHQVRVSSAGSPDVGIGAYVTGPITSSPAPVAKPREPKAALKTEAPASESKDVDPDAGAADGSASRVGAAQAGSAPVRLGSAGSVTLVRRVQPVYPPVMQAARVPGRVVLDAVIHADGTIGDVTVLQSTNDAFARSAVDAIKRWKYAPIGYEAILTVTVNFTLT